MTEEWNPNDPEATRVLYDLAGWSFDQQAELAAELAEAEVPHTWEGSELVVPETHEAQADVLISVLEERLGITYDDDDGDDEDDDDEGAGARDDGKGAMPLPIPDGEATTEYDLEEWPEGDLQTVTRALVSQHIPYAWEDDVLLVPTVQEAVVESLLDMIENGQYGVGDDDPLAADMVDDDTDQLPFEILTTFFLAGERLQRNALDADGLEQLLEALEVADPRHPPYGVDLRLWQRTCVLAEELADALAGDDVPDPDAAQETATELYALLRPFI